MYKQFAILLLCIAVSVSAAKKKSECEETRDKVSSSRSPLPLRLIPDCDANGDYKPLQCFENSKFCQCWNKTGHPMTQPSTKIRACDCLIQKQQVENRGAVGAYKPQCEQDGKFKVQQCHSSTGHCWCAHPVTGEKTTEPKRGKPKC